MKYTGTKFFGQKIYIATTGDDKVDAAIKTLFHDSFHRSAPLSMSRPDSKIVQEWMSKCMGRFNEREKE